MSAAAVRARAAVALLALALAGCGEGPLLAQAAPLEFTVGGHAVSLASGGVVRSGGLVRLYLSSLPGADGTCQGLAATPVLPTAYLSLVVAPPASGASATVVAPKATPAAGEAVGGLRQITGGVTDWALDASDGTLTWSGGASGDLQLEAIDVGFAGASGRVTASGLLLRACN